MERRRLACSDMTVKMIMERRRLACNDMTVKMIMERRRLACNAGNVEPGRRSVLATNSMSRGAA